MQATSVERIVGGRKIKIETGKIAKQAAGAVLVTCEGTVAFVAVTADKDRPELDFFPLMVDYREKTYAAGRFPGGFFKREGRPTTKEILTARLIDRPIRPLFPDGCTLDVIIFAMVLSADQENEPDVLAMIGSSAALCLSHVPFAGPTAAVRVGRIADQLVLNPTVKQMTESTLDLVIAGTKDSILMVEAGAKELPEAVMVEALEFGHAAIRELCEMQEELLAKVPRKEKTVVMPPRGTAIYPLIKDKCFDRMKQGMLSPKKHERIEARSQLKTQIAAEFVNEEAPGRTAADLDAALDRLTNDVVRALILEGRRLDGRGLTDIRPISSEVSILPRTHGSALFTRGETQALVAITLGSLDDQQIIDGLYESVNERFMLHYNFQGFCTGESKVPRGPGRREIGHGALAARALRPMLPDQESCPYTIRLVSEIMESNGSSSMASVCGGTLALMDAGVKIVRPVAGIAMGLVKEGDQTRVLSDILGDEDHFGDMDFKVAGTDQGITALQMDIKCEGISAKLMTAALAQAREGRLHILGKMLLAIDKPREDYSPYAPRLIVLFINPEKIGKLIGPGGSVIRKIQEETETKIDIDDDDSGRVVVSSSNPEGARKARETIEAICAEPEIGKRYEGKVVSIKDFGAFVEIMPGVDGLCHVSELSDAYVESVSDVVKLGDRIQVKLVSVDDQGRMRLSRKAILLEEKGIDPATVEAPRGGRGGDRGGRGGDRGGRGGDRGGRGGDRGPRDGNRPPNG